MYWFKLLFESNIKDNWTLIYLYLLKIWIKQDLPGQPCVQKHSGISPSLFSKLFSYWIDDNVSIHLFRSKPCRGPTTVCAVRVGPPRCPTSWSGTQTKACRLLPWPSGKPSWPIRRRYVRVPRSSQSFILLSLTGYGNLCYKLLYFASQSRHTTYTQLKHTAICISMSWVLNLSSDFKHRRFGWQFASLPV